MNIINKNSVALMMAAMSMPLMASNTPDVKGTIVDENGEPMSFVNVVLLSLPDSTFIQGATSDAEGSFNIVTPAEEGLLKISSVGYETQYFNTHDFAQGGILIQMRENDKMLGEVTVRAQLPKTKLTGNSMVTSIQGSVLEKSGTAKEMLAKVPGMTLKDDELEVLGKGAPVFYINGRKISDKDELKRLRSEEIQDVEVITNPGAQYDATVTAVVRIKTKRREGVGFGYDMTASNNQDFRYGYSDPNANLNLRYRHNSLDLFGSVNYWKWDNVNITDADQTSYVTTQGQMQQIMQKTLLENFWHNEGINSNLGFNWQIADQHSIGMRIERHDKIHAGSKVNEWTSISKNLLTNQGYQVASEAQTHTSQQSNIHQPYSWEGNAYYNGQIGKLNIDLNVDLMSNKASEVNNIHDHQDLGTLMQSVTLESSSMIADKLVFSYPVWKGQLQAGTEMSFVDRISKYEMRGINLPASQSEVQENNIAAFIQYGCMLPAIGNLSIGARYEHVGFDYIDLLDDSHSMTRYTDDIFPSASWSQQFSNWQTALSYSYKTSRPGYWALSEAINYLNAYSLLQGDSKLKNEKIQEISANIRWKWINLYAAYERRDNFITQWSFIYDNDTQAAKGSGLKDFEEGTMIIKNVNLDVPIRNYAVFLSASPTWGCYSPNWTIGMQQYFSELSLADPREATGQRTIRFHKPLGFFECNNTIRLKHSWQMELNASSMTAGDYSNFRFTRPVTRVGAVVQKCWLKNDALCLRASISDIFQNAGQDLKMDCGYYHLYQKQTYNSHRLDVSLRYTFNAAQSKYKGTGAGREAASRMSK